MRASDAAKALGMDAAVPGEAWRGWAVICPLPSEPGIAPEGVSPHGGFDDQVEKRCVVHSWRSPARAGQIRQLAITARTAVIK